MDVAACRGRNLRDSHERTPYPRIHPTDARRIIEKNILPLIRIVALEPEDYLAAVVDMADGDWCSGKIYDALHLRCAEKQPIRPDLYI